MRVFASILGFILLLVSFYVGIANAIADDHSAASGRLAEDWRQYVLTFVDADGRVIDNANGDVSHSESQGYAMLLAERFDDRDTFARIWTWTNDNLFIRKDRLAAWRWDPKATPHVTDHNNATDGDILLAWALSEAGTKWDRVDYRDAAIQIADAIATTLVVSSRFGPILLPAANGFNDKDQRDGPVVNLSYWIFPAFTVLENISDKTDWKAVAATGRQLIAKARFGPRKLPSNWISLAGEAPAPAQAFPRLFGYDAIRIPLYLAWGDQRDRDLLRFFVPMDLAIVDIGSGEARERLADPDYAAISRLAGCVDSGAREDAPASTFNGKFYYPATLTLLSRVAGREMVPSCFE